MLNNPSTNAPRVIVENSDVKSPSNKPRSSNNSNLNAYQKQAPGPVELNELFQARRAQQQKRMQSSQMRISSMFEHIPSAYYKTIDPHRGAGAVPLAQSHEVRNIKELTAECRAASNGPNVTITDH